MVLENVAGRRRPFILRHHGLLQLEQHLVCVNAGARTNVLDLAMTS